MPAKRQNAFSRALKEAQVHSEAAPVTSPSPQQQAPSEAQPAPSIPTTPANHASSVEEGQLARNRGGRPRSPVAKKKYTYYLAANSDDTITAIKKALVRHADVLLDDKGTVVERALAVMRFGLEDPTSRATFLALYDRWAEAAEDK
jgi:hypothetical protein